MENEDYIKKWLDDSLSEEELAEFEQTEDYQFVQRLSDALVHFKSPDFNVQEELEQLKLKKSNTKTVEMRPSHMWMKIAASIVMVLGFAFYLFQNNLPSENLAINQKSEVLLPDSTTVLLNAGSKLTFDKSAWGQSRKAYLEGEGYFEVTRGTQFDIISNAGTVSVLGTAFNIKDRESFFEVRCYHGKVKVAVDEGDIYLTANQSYRIVEGEGELIERSQSQAPSWIDGESSFQSVPYKQVLQELERQYAVKINSTPINTKLLFTGKFTHSDLTLALESITTPLNIGFKVVDSQVRLTSDTK